MFTDDLVVMYGRELKEMARHGAPKEDLIAKANELIKKLIDQVNRDEVNGMVDHGNFQRVVNGYQLGIARLRKEGNQILLDGGFKASLIKLRPELAEELK